MVAGRNLLMLQEKQADRALDALGFAPRDEAVELHDPHRHPKTHGITPLP